MKSLSERVFDATNLVAKWRTFFAGWEYGTQGMRHGPTLATKNHQERTIMLRVELSALVALLVEKGVFTTDELSEHIVVEANALNAMFENAYPGIKATPIGLDFRLPESLETMKKLGFPA